MADGSIMLERIRNKIGFKKTAGQTNDITLCAIGIYTV